ncbi:hypothetical protein CDD80_4689 [Ophiocordyceps camponoti-rufipedis]|uniref:Uncharacterized protein n=1 Tax=Ophiocordyceps camponoti-rufipedis TaxID=2004952 RepID=A0A2C5YRP4_9HYPO|nr:hypothetical protein CDD80_4689 [Ophiocordyceps camponoti-rufipedis]
MELEVDDTYSLLQATGLDSRPSGWQRIDGLCRCRHTPAGWWWWINVHGRVQDTGTWYDLLQHPRMDGRASIHYYVYREARRDARPPALGLRSASRAEAVRIILALDKGSTGPPGLSPRLGVAIADMSHTRGSATCPAHYARYSALILPVPGTSGSTIRHATTASPKHYSHLHRAAFRAEPNESLGTYNRERRARYPVPAAEALSGPISFSFWLISFLWLWLWPAWSRQTPARQLTVASSAATSIQRHVRQSRFQVQIQVHRSTTPSPYLTAVFRSGTAASGRATRSNKEKQPRHFILGICSDPPLRTTTVAPGLPSRSRHLVHRRLNPIPGAIHRPISAPEQPLPGICQRSVPQAGIGLHPAATPRD